MFKAMRWVLVSTAMWGAFAAQAEDGEDLSNVKKALSKAMPNVTPDLIAPAPVPGFYEVLMGTDIVYISKDGHYLLQGDLYDLQTRTNVTENKRSIGRQKVIQRLNESSMIVFSPQSVKHTVTVFTDVDCGYCRKLHKEMDDYLARGIRIRYLAYPRSGPNTPSYFKMAAVWCAEDPKAAMTASKSGGKVAERKCKHPMDEHMAAAQAVGVSGTPTIVMDNGAVLPGYLPADKLLEMLNENAKK